MWTNCLVEDCERDTYGGSRGMCINHYSAKSFQVKIKKTTWEKLEAAGLAKPKRTKEEHSRSRKHPNRKKDEGFCLTLDNVDAWKEAERKKLSTQRESML